MSSTEKNKQPNTGNDDNDDQPGKGDTAAKVVGTAAGVTGVGAAAVGGGATVAGFTTSGIAAGSVAAGIQSTIGNVVAGSAFATAQSLGATGVFVTMGLAAIPLVVVAGGAAAYVYRKKIKNGLTKMFKKKESPCECKGPNFRRYSNSNVCHICGSKLNQV